MAIGAAWTLAAVAALLLAISRGAKARVGSDFHVFWQAGHDFANHMPLYARPEGARPFIYPPFAAQLFQLLAVFPLKSAATLFVLASVFCWIAVALITQDIVRILHGRSGRERSSLVLAVILSAQFVLNNLNMVQTNLLVMLMCLLGIHRLISHRPLAGGMWLAAATGFKVTPVFLGIWAAVRGGRSARAGLLVGGLGCVLLPILQRGFTQGLVDLGEYYETFLRQFALGGVVRTYTNQTLGAMVYRAVSGDPRATRYEYTYLPGLEPWAPVIYRVLAALLLIVFLSYLVGLARAHAPMSALEISSVFLIGHLLSGITWKAHLVTFVFVFYAFFSLRRDALKGWRRYWLVTAWVVIPAMGLLGRDLVGDEIHHYAGGYSVFVWGMLLLFVLGTTWSTRAGPDAERRTRRT